MQMPSKAGRGLMGTQGCPAQFVHDVLIVNDLVAHVNRLVVFLQRAFDDLNRAHDASAEAPRLSENHSQGGAM